MTGIVIRSTLICGKGTVDHTNIQQPFIDYMCDLLKIDKTDQDEVNSLMSSNGGFGWFNCDDGKVIYVYDDLDIITYIPL